MHFYIDPEAIRFMLGCVFGVCLAFLIFYGLYRVGTRKNTGGPR